MWLWPQSPPRRGRNMLRLSLLLVLLTHHTPAYVTDSPSFADRLDRLYEKLERFTVAPVAQPSEESLLAKIDKLNAIGPRELTDEDEELLSAMQMWGMLSADQLQDVVKELQMEKEEKSEKMMDSEYADSEWDEDLNGSDYAMDGDWDDDLDVESSTSKPSSSPASSSVVTPFAFTRQNVQLDSAYREVVSAVDAVAATNERPKILDDSLMSLNDKAVLRTAAVSHFRLVYKEGKCLSPQPRWISVNQMAPAADIRYMPSCVRLHRCAADTGCCFNESQVCAPVDGEYVRLPFFLKKASGELSEARMLFYNHTRCACVSRDTLETTVQSRAHTQSEPRHSTPVRRESVKEVTREQREQREGPNDWRSTEEPRLERDEEPTAPPQLRRCTCPGLFLAKMSDSGNCSCVCDWADSNKRRDCYQLARGREHFGLRDRVCVANGDCNPPTCEYGAYERNTGRCPQRRFRRLRFHRGRIDKIVV